MSKYDPLLNQYAELSRQVQRDMEQADRRVKWIFIFVVSTMLLALAGAMALVIVKSGAIGG